jgi:hypothetical protein
MITMGAGDWVERYTAGLRETLTARNIEVDPTSARLFVTSMVTFIAEAAGISESAAQQIITPAALPGWADSFVGPRPTPGGMDMVMIAAHTAAEAAATLMELSRATATAERVADHAAFSAAQFDGDSGLLRDEALQIRQRVSALSMQLSIHLLSQPPAEMMRLPESVHAELCAMLDDVASSAVIDVAERSSDGVYCTTADGDFTLRDVLAATVHDLDVTMQRL